MVELSKFYKTSTNLTNLTIWLQIEQEDQVCKKIWLHQSINLHWLWVNRNLNQSVCYEKLRTLDNFNHQWQALKLNQDFRRKLRLYWTRKKILVGSNLECKLLYHKDYVSLLKAVWTVPFTTSSKCYETFTCLYFQVCKLSQHCL